MTGRPVSRAVTMLPLAAAVLLLAGPLAAADKVSADRLLPPEVKLFVSISNVADVKTRWKEILFSQLQNDRELADFRKAVDEQLQEVSAKLEDQVGVKLSDLWNVPSGEITFAMWHTPGAKLSYAAFLDFGDSRETVDQLLSKAADALDKQGAKRKTEEFEDVRIITYVLPAEKDDDDDALEKTSGGEFSYFVNDSYLVVGNNVAALKAILARWDGKHPKTFADSEVYRYIIERCKSERTSPVANWYVDPVGLLRSIVSSAEEPDFQTQLMLGFLPALGVTKLKAIGGSIDIATGEFDTVSRMVVYVDTPTTGVLNVFQFPAIEQQPPKWVPASASSYYTGNWNVPGAYAAINSLYDSIIGQGAFSSIIDDLAKNEGGPMLHIKQDLIDQLSGRIHFLSIPAESDDNADAPAAERSLVAFGVKDSAKMKAVLAKLAETPGFPGKVREFRDETIYELSIQQLTTGIGVTKGHLMIASDVTLLEGIIRGGENQKSLAETVKYRRIAKKFPAKTAIIGFQNQNSQAKAFYEMLRSGQAGVSIPGLDFQKLPPFTAIDKYLRTSGSYFVPDKHGAFHVSFTLRDN